MTLDITNILSTVSEMVGESIKEAVGEASGDLLEVLEDRRDGLSELLQAVEDGDLTEDDLKEELEREKIVLETEMLAKQIAAKAEIQKAINAAMDALTGMVKAAL